MTEETPWVWNKGIAALCDHRLPEDFPRGKYCSHETSLERSKPGSYSTIARRVCSGDLVWVKVDWLPFFVSCVLPEIKNDFILVTGDSDLSMPSAMQSEAERIIASEHVIHWYTQNYDGTAAEKTSPLPIGMDFHSIQQQDYWGIWQLPITKQYEVLETIRRQLPPVERRVRKLYIDSEFLHRNDPMRQGSVNQLTRAGVHRLMNTDSAVYLQQHFLPQFEMWKRRGQFTYVLSHHGNGLDCHRSWEALVLGHVLVVQKSSLDSLYKDLPVIIIEDWQMVKSSSVAEFLKIDMKQNWNLEKLTSRYWVDKMRRRAQQSISDKRNSVLL